MNISKFNTKKVYIALVAVVVIGFCCNVFLFTQSTPHVQAAKNIPEGGGFVSTYSATGVTLASLPVIHNLPLDISWSQNVKIRTYLSEQAGTGSISDAYYRDGSLRSDSNGLTLLIDIPSTQQTFTASTLTDGNIAIDCATKAEQKETTWSCVTNTNYTGAE